MIEIPPEVPLPKLCPLCGSHWSLGFVPGPPRSTVDSVPVVLTCTNQHEERYTLTDDEFETLHLFTWGSLNGDVRTSSGSTSRPASRCYHHRLTPLQSAKQQARRCRKQCQCRDRSGPQLADQASSGPWLMRQRDAIVRCCVADPFQDAPCTPVFACKGRRRCR
jgi:hypothetical protein